MAFSGLAGGSVPSSGRRILAFVPILRVVGAGARRHGDSESWGLAGPGRRCHGQACAQCITRVPDFA